MPRHHCRQRVPANDAHVAAVAGLPEKSTGIWPPLTAKCRATIPAPRPFTPCVLSRWIAYATARTVGSVANVPTSAFNSRSNDACHRALDVLLRRERLVAQKPHGKPFAVGLSESGACLDFRQCLIQVHLISLICLLLVGPSSLANASIVAGSDVPSIRQTAYSDPQPMPIGAHLGRTEETAACGMHPAAKHLMARPTAHAVLRQRAYPNHEDAPWPPTTK